MDSTYTSASQLGQPLASQPVVVHMPVDVRSFSLVTLSLLGTIYTLRWAAPVFVPISVILMLTYTLFPQSVFLKRAYGYPIGSFRLC